MFDYKHEIELITSERICLNGEGFFTDKSTFWKAHQTDLNHLYDRVTATGFPIRIKDLETNNTLTIGSLESFHEWLRDNQPFNFARVTGFFEKEHVQSITFGNFNSSSWSNPIFYRVTPRELEKDASGNYPSQRFSMSGYRFEGKPLDLPTTLQIAVRELLEKVPWMILELELPQPNSPGNKEEFTTYVRIDFIAGHAIEFKIDAYTPEDLNSEPAVLSFVDEIKRIITLIQAVK